jgi:pimeloyl-ACP methyl ester carboxylesterase
MAKTFFIFCFTGISAVFIISAVFMPNQGQSSSSTFEPQPWSWTSQQFKQSDVPCDLPNPPAIFSPDDTANPEHAYLLMSASHLAYRFWPGRREKILQRWGFRNFKTFDNRTTSTNGFWAEHNSFVLLVFRGTQEPKDLMTDLNVELTALPSDWHDHGRNSGRVHRGFLTAAQSVKQNALDAADLAQNSGKPLILAGHSLGGAVALLTAFYLEHKNFKIHSVWNFGSPKIGDSRFLQTVEDELTARWHRIIQPNDPIPMLPFSKNDQAALQSFALQFGKHIPLLHRFAENAEYEGVNDENNPNSALLKLATASLKDVAKGMIEHLPRSYLCHLSQNQLPLE